MSSKRYFKAITSQQFNFDPYFGRWIRLETKFGSFDGIVERVRDDAVLLKMPKSTLPKLLGYPAKNPDIQLAGGSCEPGCYPHPHRICGPWWWCWFPIIIIIFYSTIFLVIAANFFACSQNLNQRWDDAHRVLGSEYSV